MATDSAPTTIIPVAWKAPWIAVAECVPEALHDVLVQHLFINEPSVDIAYRKMDGRWVITGTDPELYIEPTAWLPLPAAGEEVPHEQ